MATTSNPCPECGTEMSQLRGGGAIETFCPSCGFGVRQSVARPVSKPHARWFANLDAIGGFALPRADKSPKAGFRFTTRNLVALAAWVLLAISIRAMFVGYSSFEPVLFAELYIQFFALVMACLTLLRTIPRLSGRQIIALLVGAIVGAMLLVKLVKVLKLLPTTWEPEYCGELFYPYYTPDFVIPPKTFRCTSVPIVTAGLFLGWWLTYWIITRWEHRTESQ